VILPGRERVEFRELDRPEPGHGQVLVKMKASGLCGSDLRAIYHEHTGSGAERYQNVVAGHEPSGQVEAVGPGVSGFEPGDRVVVCHILGCGRCEECTKGFMIGCTSQERSAYGWQRDGGHADYLLAEAITLLHLPEGLTYTDGALVACGFGTAYQGILRADVSGRDTVLVVGLGPVGLGTVMLAASSGADVIGVDLNPRAPGAGQESRRYARPDGRGGRGGGDTRSYRRPRYGGRHGLFGKRARKEAVPGGGTRMGTGRLHRRGRLCHV
jgi:D-arabinose 1-dehydrogenase-like Zn-dependent alcohol dehydrogenase